LQGKLFELPVRAAAASDCPESWIRNVEVVDLWAREQQYQTRDVNWFKLPDGSMVCSLPEGACGGERPAAVRRPKQRRQLLTCWAVRYTAQAAPGPFAVPARRTAPTFLPVHLDILDHGHMEKGGRGLAKSSFLSLEVVQLIRNNPKVHALYCRKAGSTLQSSVYNQILRAIRGGGTQQNLTKRSAPCIMDGPAS